MLHPKEAWRLFKAAVQAWSNDYAPSMGAALSYYTLFAIAPLLVIVISVAGWAFGEQAVRGEVTAQLQWLMGEQGAKAIEGMIASASDPKDGAIAALIGFFVLLLGATTVFGELQNDLDRIWRAPAQRQSGSVWRLLRSRLLSIGMIVSIAFLLMVSLVFDAVLQVLGALWGTGGWKALAQALNTVVAFGLTTTVFALIYKLMPRARIEWHDVWVGAAVTALLFTVGKYLISLYIGRSAVASSFGAAGSLAVVMIWVYYSAQIFLLGAEFTWVYAHSHGSRKDENAKPVPAPAPPPRLAHDPLPAHKRHPVASFGLAAAFGAIAGLLSRFKLR
jgi:membrane protein